MWIKRWIGGGGGGGGGAMYEQVGFTLVHIN